MFTAGLKPVFCVSTPKLRGVPVLPWSHFGHLNQKFHHVHIDIVGRLPVSRGFPNLLTCVDRFTRCPEVTPIEDITEETITRAFVTTWKSRIGRPFTITADRGRQF